MAFLWMLTFLGPAWADDTNEGEQIAREQREARRGYVTEISDMELSLYNTNGTRTTRRLQMLTKEVEGDGDRARTEVTWPADVKGTRMLSWAHIDRRDDQWLYLPALSTVKRITGGSVTASFMGSEFSMEDFATTEVEKFTYSYLGEETYRGRPTHKFERVPTDKRSGYSKQVVWSDKEYKQPLRIDYYDRKGELLKICEMSEFRKVGGYWGPERIEMKNVQTRKSSVLAIQNRVVGDPLDDGLFVSHSLGD